ncbi:hypothetical protein L7F22_047532 [Adiantum nelumboides]|nr:hypothetical protein [Adiantum nelumboides]
MMQDQLRYEMESEIKRLGRSSLIDLANTIGVDLYYCEKQADSIISCCPTLMLVQGEIISTSYWDAVAEEISESLQETGQVSLADLAARLNVSSDTLTAMLEPRMGKQTKAEKESEECRDKVAGTDEGGEIKEGAQQQNRRGDRDAGGLNCRAKSKEGKKQGKGAYERKRWNRQGREEGPQEQKGYRRG